MLSLLFIVLIFGFFIQVIISFTFVFKIILQYRDSASLQVLIAFSFLNLSIFLSIFWIDQVVNDVNDSSIYYRLFLIFAYLTGLSICLILDKKFYSFKTRVLSKITFTLYTICMSLTISDIVTKDNNFYYIYRFDNKLIPYYGYYGGLFLVLANILLLVTFYLSYRDLRTMPKIMVADKSFSLITGIAMIIIGIFVIDFYLQISNLASIGQYGEFINVSYFITLNLISIMFTYFSFTQTFLHFSGNPNPNTLIKKGFIGYFLASVTNNGPEPLTHSKAFVDYSQLPQESLLGLAFSAISIVGMFSGTKENSFKSRVSLIPVPGTVDYSTLVYTFFVRNEANEDERTKEQAPTAYCIMFPSNFSLDLRKMTSTLSDVLSVVERDRTIENINNDEMLFQLTNIILRKMLV